MVTRDKAKEWRTQRGLTQHEMASRVGVSYVTYSNYERGETQTMMPQNMRRLEHVVRDGGEPETLPEVLLHGGFSEVMVRILAEAARAGDRALLEEALELAQLLDEAQRETTRAAAKMEEAGRRIGALTQRLTTK